MSSYIAIGSAVIQESRVNCDDLEGSGYHFYYIPIESDKKVSLVIIGNRGFEKTIEFQTNKEAFVFFVEQIEEYCLDEEIEIDYLYFSYFSTKTNDWYDIRDTSIFGFFSKHRA